MQRFPIDFHCHGIGPFDFAEPNDLVLDDLELSLVSEGIGAILTMYLPKSKLPDFESLMHSYHEGYISGRYRHILGIALEGPMLSSFGGTPEQGCWSPNIEEWRRLSALGKLGLTYIVISPDVVFTGASEFPPDILWVVKELTDNGITPALGHFLKDNPELSARKISEVCDFILVNKLGPIFTDHLFNDMPLNFVHSWRSEKAKKERDNELTTVLNSCWDSEHLGDTLGLVPAKLIEYAKAGALLLCLNFDGDHVDLEICKKAVSEIGSSAILIMTDRIQSEILGGQALTRHSSNSLLYQKDKIVAGGTQSMMSHIMNMVEIGILSEDIYNIVYRNASRVLNRSKKEGAFLGKWGEVHDNLYN